MLFANEIRMQLRMNVRAKRKEIRESKNTTQFVNSWNFLLQFEVKVRFIFKKFNNSLPSQIIFQDSFESCELDFRSNAY